MDGWWKSGHKITIRKPALWCRRRGKKHEGEHAELSLKNNNRKTSCMDATWETDREMARQMEGGIIDSAHFNQTVQSGGEEMAALFFTAATIDLRCSLSNQSQYGELQTICWCSCGQPECLLKAILLNASKWHKALDLHLTTAAITSDRASI